MKNMKQSERTRKKAPLQVKYVYRKANNSFKMSYKIVESQNFFFIV